MAEMIFDALKDSLRLLPFLFLTYLAMELLEHHAGDKTQRWIRRAGVSGPVWGAVLGVVPQCGFSAAAASLYAGRVVTLGTMLAIFLSTSDEMLPILLAEQISGKTIAGILAAKVGIAMISGLAVDLTGRFLLHRQEENMDIHTVCVEEHCSCEDGVLKSAVKHTVKIFAFILLISVGVNAAISLVGDQTVAGLFQGMPVVGELIAALVGLIPNCASSVMITQMYLQGILGAGEMMSGLLVNAGVGLLVLFRLNRNWKKNAGILALLYALGVFWGVVIEMTGIIF